MSSGASPGARRARVPDAGSVSRTGPLLLLLLFAAAGCSDSATVPTSTAGPDADAAAATTTDTRDTRCDVPRSAVSAADGLADRAREIHRHVAASYGDRPAKAAAGFDDASTRLYRTLVAGAGCEKVKVAYGDTREAFGVLVRVLGGSGILKRDRRLRSAVDDTRAVLRELGAALGDLEPVPGACDVTRKTVSAGQGLLKYTGAVRDYLRRNHRSPAVKAAFALNDAAATTAKGLRGGATCRELEKSLAGLESAWSTFERAVKGDRRLLRDRRFRSLFGETSGRFDRLVRLVEAELSGTI